MKIALPETSILHIAANENIGRIAVDGMHQGKPVAVVIEPGEVPRSVKTQQQLQAYLLDRIKQAAEEKQ